MRRKKIDFGAYWVCSNCDKETNHICVYCGEYMKLESAMVCVEKFGHFCDNYCYNEFLKLEQEVKRIEIKKSIKTKAKMGNKNGY